MRSPQDSCQPGARLPPERALARELGVNRTTVMNAYDELTSEGLIEGHVGRGTHVKRIYFHQEEPYFSADMPSWLLGLAPPDAIQSKGKEERVGMPYLRYRSDVEEQASAEKKVISFVEAAPALDLYPTSAIQMLVGETLMEARQSALGYCPVEGLESLRREIAAHMRKRGVAVDSNNILILSGSTQGIGLIGRFLLQPGDEVVVEIPTYLGAIQTFRELHARIIGIPTDGDGMRIDLLEAILARRQPRLILYTPDVSESNGCDDVGGTAATVATTGTALPDPHSGR